jgi:3',5'-cyclic AMP phosphodiesterase CpdA
MTTPHRARSILRGSLWIIGILLLVGAAAWGLDRPLPGEKWNVQALRQIEASRSGPLAFAVLGDSRNSHGRFARLLQQMAAEPDLVFAIHLGDMVPQGDEPDFRSFFQEVRGYLPIPLLGVPGNHDLKPDGSRVWERLLGPRDYAFQVQGRRFIVLDDNAPDLDEGQLRWLAEELRQSQACPARLVFMHRPLFDPRGAPHHHALPPEVGRKLASLFQQHRVTHVFAGHIHGYFTGEWSGVPYTITGGGGVKLAGTDPAHYFYHYLKVKVTGGGVMVRVQRLAGAP